MIIDFHRHYADSDNYIENLLKEMDEAHVDYTLLTSSRDEGFWEYKKCGYKRNEDTLEAVKRYPDRIIGNVYIDPRKPDAIETFERFMDKGFKCVKMFPPEGYYPDEERFFPLYEKIEEYEVPILFHTGLTNVAYMPSTVRRATSSKYSNPMYIDLLTRMFPKINFVFAHMGYPHFSEAWSIAHVNNNVYLDIAGSGPWTEGAPVAYNALGGQSYIPIDFSRVIWGSDNCLPQVESMARASTYIRLMGCHSAERKCVFGETAAKLLKLL